MNAAVNTDLLKCGDTWQTYSTTFLWWRWCRTACSACTGAFRLRWTLWTRSGLWTDCKKCLTRVRCATCCGATLMIEWAGAYRPEGPATLSAKTSANSSITITLSKPYLEHTSWLTMATLKPTIIMLSLYSQHLTIAIVVETKLPSLKLMKTSTNIICNSIQLPGLSLKLLPKEYPTTSYDLKFILFYTNQYYIIISLIITIHKLFFLLFYKYNFNYSTLPPNPNFQHITNPSPFVFINIICIRCILIYL